MATKELVDELVVTGCTQSVTRFADPLQFE